MKEFALYAWEFDGEGGYAVCKTEEFHKPYGYKVAKLGEFNSREELVQLLIADGYCTAEEAENDATSLMGSF